MKTGAQLLALTPIINPDIKLAATGIDTMSPDNPGLLALAEIPVEPPIKAHSIIDVKGDDLPPNGGDGVVKYTSAHIEGVESELVVRSGHSCQGAPWRSRRCAGFFSNTCGRPVNRSRLEPQPLGIGSRAAGSWP